jgi:transcription antitermination factor NusG
MNGTDPVDFYSSSDCKRHGEATPDPTARVVEPVATELTDCAQTPWYALQTRANHERKVAERLNSQDITSIVPIFSEVHRWKDRNKKVELPVFPGYVFVQMDLAERMRAIVISGVVRFVGMGTMPTPIPDAEMEVVNACLRHGGLVRPHAYVMVGSPVNVVSGPLQGMRGILLRRKGVSRLVLSVSLIQSSVAIEVDDTDVVPADPIPFLTSHLRAISA